MDTYLEEVSMKTGTDARGRGIAIGGGGRIDACVCAPVLQNRFRGVPPGKIDPFLIDVFVLSAKCKKTVAKSAKVLQLFPPKHPYLVVSTTVRACAYSPAISR